MSQAQNLFDKDCKNAANKIKNCDFLLVTCGAGFSADSGLPVYKDIADDPEYTESQLSYSDLCSPECMETNPKMFFRFW
eukprot:Pgem_evm2s18610